MRKLTDSHFDIKIESRWSDVKSSVLVLLSVCSAILLPTKAVSNEPKTPPTQKPILELKVDPRDPKEQEKEKEREKDKDKIKLPGPLPDIPIPKISLDDLMEKVHDLGEKIGEEIKGRVPTLADYFTAVDTVRKELRLGDGSLYQSIVNNMSDANKNPEIQLDASVRWVCVLHMISDNGMSYKRGMLTDNINVPNMLLIRLSLSIGKETISVHKSWRSRQLAGKR